MSRESLVELVLGYLSLAGWLALLVGATLAPVRRAVRDALAAGPGAPTGRELLALLALTLGAFALRTLLAEPSALLGTFNDVKHLQDALCLARQTRVCELTHAYPTALTALHAVFVRLLGPSLEGMYVTNAVLSAATVPAAWLLGALWLEDRRGGWWTAVGLAALPLAILYAATGALATGFLFLATLALAVATVALRTGSAWAAWGAAVALSMAVHARPEGPAILGIAALLFAAEWRTLRERLRDARFRRHFAGAALLVTAAGGLAIGLFVLGGVDAGGGGWPRFARKLLVVAGALGAYAALAWGLARWSVPRRVRWGVGVAVGVALFFALGLGAVPAERWVAASPWPAFAAEGLHVPSYGGPSWPLVNPRAVPLPVLLLLFAGVAAGLVKARPTVVVAGAWAALLAVVTSQKDTGEIPFEGLRTAVDSATAVVFVAAAGASALADAVKTRGAGRVLTGGLLLLLGSAPLWSLPMLTDRHFNNAAQLAFLERTLPELPADAVVLYPDGGSDPGRPPFADLFRVREVWWVTGRTGGLARKDRFVGVTRALADKEPVRRLVEAGRPVLFWEGLACSRTGAPHPPLRPECAAMHEQFRLRPLASETVPNRPIEWDWFDRYLIHGDDVTLTVYAVEGLRDAR